MHRYDDYVCYSSCAATGYSYDISGSQKCYNDCSQTDDDKYHVNGTFTCIHNCTGLTSFYNNGEKVCYSDCPPGRWHRYNDTICFATCNDTGYQYFINGENECYPSCADTPNNKFHVHDTYNCIDECPDTEKYYIESEKICYEECPTGNWYHRVD